jgi:hypothetical protein
VIDKSALVIMLIYFYKEEKRMVEKSKTVHVVEIHGQANNLHSTLQSLKKDF